jgi:hypothetical protein
MLSVIKLIVTKLIVIKHTFNILTAIMLSSVMLSSIFQSVIIILSVFKQLSIMYNVILLIVFGSIVKAPVFAPQEIVNHQRSNGDDCRFPD